MYTNNNVATSKGKLPTRAYEQKTVFVIVNGISTGRHIAPFLRGHGYDAIIHIMTKGCEATKIPHNQGDYVLNIKESDFTSLDEMLRSLSPYKITAIFPGSESAVTFVDEMNHRLNMPNQNEYKLTGARTDKYLMQAAMKAAGLNHARQIKASDSNTILRWAEEKEMYPIVIKPLASAGSDGVHFCDNAIEAREAIDTLLGKPNVFGVTNQSIVAQEKLLGDEFMVNTVSWGKDIYVVDIIASIKKMQDGNPLYDYAVNIPRSDPRFKRIEDYVKKALPAVGLHYGAAHTEVILTKNGPTLVEVNARLIGTFDMSATFKALGQNHVTTLMNTYLDPEFLPLLIKKGQVKENEGFVVTSFFIAEEKIQIRRPVDTSSIEKIEGYHNMKFGGKPGATLAKTTDMFNMPGLVSFVGASLEEVIESHAEFRRTEQAFYRELQTSPASVTTGLFAEKKKQVDTTHTMTKQLLTGKIVCATLAMTLLLCVLCKPSKKAQETPHFRM